MNRASSTLTTGVTSSAARQPNVLWATTLRQNVIPMPTTTPTALASLIAAGPAGPWWSLSAAMAV